MQRLTLSIAMLVGVALAACGAPNPKTAAQSDARALDAGPGDGREAEAACRSAGGRIVSRLCCKAASEFPNTCLIGACGCSPENSAPLSVCECPEGKCFDGAACVQR